MCATAIVVANCWAITGATIVRVFAAGPRRRHYSLNSRAMADFCFRFSPYTTEARPG